MKQSNFNSKQTKFGSPFKNIPLLSTLFLTFMFLTCSNEGFDSLPLQEANSTLKTGKELNSWEMEVEHLTKKMRRFYNHQVAIAQGWDTDGTGYIPNMGHHFINESLIDGTFELEKPEALLYVPDDNGVMQFVGVEYLVLMDALEDPSTPPAGFIGDEDIWVIVGPFWTLHAWVGLENPDGVFAPFNPLVD